MKQWILAGGLVALLTLTALALPQSAAPAAPGESAPAAAAAPSPEAAVEPEQDAEDDWTRRWKYTKADYQLALNVKTEGYQSLSVEEFNRALLDWRDEEAFHQREEAYRRLMNSYPYSGDDPGFIHLTLAASFDECSAKHYGGHCDRVTPTFWDSAARVREEDVFGDSYTVFEAEADYEISYHIEDEAKLTVGERDKVLLAYRQGVQAFLDGKTEAELENEKAMAKALKAELKRLDGALSTPLITLTGTQLSDYGVWDSRE